MENSCPKQRGGESRELASSIASIARCLTSPLTGGGVVQCQGKEGQPLGVRGGAVCIEGERDEMISVLSKILQDLVRPCWIFDW